MLNISSILYNCMRNIMLIASIFCVYDTATLHLLTLYSPWWWTRNIFTFCLWLVVSNLNLHSRLAKSIVPRLDITVTQDDLGDVGWLYGPTPTLPCSVLFCSVPNSVFLQNTGQESKSQRFSTSLLNELTKKWERSG